MPRKSFKVKFSMEINTIDYHKKIVVGIEPGPFPDPRIISTTSYIKNDKEKIRKESITNLTKINKIFGDRLKQFVDIAFN